MLLLGRKTARERIASFLIDLPAHDPARPRPAGHVWLPMTRSEIADYLGLTIETVSRVLTRLKTSNVIKLISASELRIEQPAALRAIAEGED
jgi:CRP/FNR family transcriptional regulator